MLKTSLEEPHVLELCNWINKNSQKISLSLTSGTVLILFTAGKKQLTESLCQTNARNFLVHYEQLLLGRLGWSGT